MSRRPHRRTAAATGLLVGGAAACFWLLTTPEPLPASAIPAHAPDRANGEVFFHAGSCLACHRPPEGKGDASLPSGGRPIKTPIGAFYPQNLTPYPETGLGRWSEVDFVNAMTRGLAPDGRHYFPAFPYIAVLAALGIPSMIKMVPRIKLNNSTMVLSNTIAVTRMRAISKSSDFRITFDTAVDGYTIEKWTGTAWVSLGLTKVNGTDLASVTGFTPAANVLVVHWTGQTNVTLGTQGFIELQTPDGQLGRRITVEPTGRMFVEHRSGPAPVGL